MDRQLLDNLLSRLARLRAAPTTLRSLKYLDDSEFLEDYDVVAEVEISEDADFERKISERQKALTIEEE